MFDDNSDQSIIFIDILAGIYTVFDTDKYYKISIR